MKTRWIGAAAAALCVGQSAWAQYPPAGGPLPEPAPEAVCPPQGQGGKQFVPGPLTGAAAPPGPGDPLSLPPNIPTAWGLGPMAESGVYLHAGGMGLMRERPGHAVVATDNGTVVQTTYALDPSYYYGGRLTVGYLYDDAAIELTAFYLPEESTSSSVIDPGHVMLPFINPPAAFQGGPGNSLFVAADRVTTTLQTSVGSAELNYRWWSRALTGVETIVGLRYFELDERGTILADDSLSPILNNPGTTIDPRPLQATYLSRADNHMLMAQTGFEWNLPLTDWLSFGVMVKAGVGADNADVTTRLTRGDAVVAFNDRRSDWNLTSLYEVNAFFDLVTLEKMRIRLGYTALWALNVEEALSQVNFDLATQSGVKNTGGSVYFHGPMLEVQFLF